jgi:hypothetical protein
VPVVELSLRGLVAVQHAFDELPIMHFSRSPGLDALLVVLDAVHSERVTARVDGRLPVPHARIPAWL